VANTGDGAASRYIKGTKRAGFCRRRKIFFWVSNNIYGFAGHLNVFWRAFRGYGGGFPVFSCGGLGGF